MTRLAKGDMPTYRSIVRNIFTYHNSELRNVYVNRVFVFTFLLVSSWPIYLHRTQGPASVHDSPYNRVPDPFQVADPMLCLRKQMLAHIEPVVRPSSPF